MRNMKWENLKTGSCPRCAGLLATLNGEYVCSECTFHCDIARGQKIMMHRNSTVQPTVRIKWQYVKQDLCPICFSPLEEMRADTHMRLCSDKTCRFRIKQETLDEMIADPHHPCNRFKP